MHETDLSLRLVKLKLRSGKYFLRWCQVHLRTELVHFTRDILHESEKLESVFSQVVPSLVLRQLSARPSDVSPQVAFLSFTIQNPM